MHFSLFSEYLACLWGDKRREQTKGKKTHQCCREDHETGRDGRESLEKQALEKLIIIICIKWHSQAHT